MSDLKIERMKRVLLIGSPAAGKSYFSRALGKVVSLPVYHLDYYAWQDRWDKDPVKRKKQWHQFVLDLSGKKEWIIDCNNMTALKAAVPQTDTILFLDYPRWLRVARVFKRTIKYRRKLRIDMPDGWQEKLELKFLKEIWNFEKNDRIEMMSILDRRNEESVKIFKSPHQASKYLKRLKGI